MANPEVNVINSAPSEQQSQDQVTFELMVINLGERQLLVLPNEEALQHLLGVLRNNTQSTPATATTNCVQEEDPFPPLIIDEAIPSPNQIQVIWNDQPVVLLDPMLPPPPPPVVVSVNPPFVPGHSVPQKKQKKKATDNHKKQQRVVPGTSAYSSAGPATGRPRCSKIPAKVTRADTTFEDLIRLPRKYKSRAQKQPVPNTKYGRLRQRNIQASQAWRDKCRSSELVQIATLIELKEQTDKLTAENNALLAAIQELDAKEKWLQDMVRALARQNGI